MFCNDHLTRCENPNDQYRVVKVKLGDLIDNNRCDRAVRKLISMAVVLFAFQTDAPRIILAALWLWFELYLRFN